MNKKKINGAIQSLIMIEGFAQNHNKSFELAKQVDKKRRQVIKRLERVLDEEGVDYFSFITFQLAEQEKKNLCLLAEVSEYFLKKQQHKTDAI